MGLPRSRTVREGKVGVYHTYTRCVRRAFLCGFDPVTQRDFSHRKAWIVDRLRFLASVFAIDVISYSVLHTHYHTILRLRPDIVDSWSDREVAIRWLTLSPKKTSHPTELLIASLSNSPERIAQLRKRLCSLSWFMAHLNEFIARAANKEDNVKGRFWESRFKSRALLDVAAIAACMVYVDLNPIRAELASTPEDSDFTSIQQRIRAWRAETMAQKSTPNASAQSSQPSSLDQDKLQSADASDVAGPVPESIPTEPSKDPASSACWLCPIQSDPHRRGILNMTEAEYFDLVDKSGRILRSGKRGAIDPDLAPILARIGANPEAWTDTITRFGSRFRLAAGLLSSLRMFADQLGKRWFVGISSAKAAFVTSPTLLT